MGRKVLLALAVLGVIGREVSADAIKTVEPLAPPLSFDHLGAADGLPTSDVRAIVQDTRGFMWFGTPDGLVRYDGSHMLTYRPRENDPTSLSGVFVTALALDPSGKIWVGTAENGVCLYDPDTDKFKCFRKGQKGEKGLPSADGVNAITRDHNDRMWFALNGGGIDGYDPNSGTFTNYPTGKLDSPISAIGVDKSGVLWLGTGGDGLMRWDPKNGDNNLIKPTAGDEHGLGAAGINVILGTTTGTVWVGTEGDGAFSFDAKDPSKAVRHHHAPDASSISEDHITALYEDRHGNVWIGTHNGLDRIDPQGHITNFHQDEKDPQSLTFPQISSLFQDAGGVFWIGGFTGGICKFDELRPKFGHYRAGIFPSQSAAWEDNEDTMWIGTYTGGLYKFEFAAGRRTFYKALVQPGQPQLDLVGNWLMAMIYDKGTLWLGTRGAGLIAFDTKTETFKHWMPDPDKGDKAIPIENIFSMHQDDKGDLWLGTIGAGLVRFDPKTEVFTTIPSDQQTGLTSTIYRIYPDPTEKRILWIGTAGSGVVRFDTVSGQGTAFRHKADDPTSLSGDDAVSLYRDKAGALWVGTYGNGMNRLDPATGKAEHWNSSTTKGMNDVIYGILPDDDGKLWLSTNGVGLLQWDPKDNTFLKFDSSDGAQANEYGQGAFRRSKSGKLYFGGVAGFNLFNPKDISRDTYVPPVVITEFTVRTDEKVKLDKPPWTLPPAHVSYSDSFEVTFAGLAYAAPNRTRYAYKLEGFDDKFIEVDATRPYASYTRLPGGHYSLRIRAANRHGVWNETGVALEIAVKPPIWRTWPAFVVYVAILALAVFLFLRWQQGRVKRAEREGRLAVVEHDLALSGAVQSGFLPEYNEINGANLQLYGFYRAADACSGDWWWHELYGSRHVVLVGDVTGHGPGPAMVTAAVATAFRVVSAGGIIDVQQTLELLNQVVLHVAKGKYHMTMAALEIDELTGEYVVHSAGAPPILMLDANGKHKVYFCPGAPLGTETDFEIGRLQGKLAPSERIMLYTDGLPEIALPNGNVLGMRRFAQMYERTRAQNLKDAATQIVVTADQNRGTVPQGDDWTMAIVEWRGAQGQNNFY